LAGSPRPPAGDGPSAPDPVARNENKKTPKKSFLSLSVSMDCDTGRRDKDANSSMISMHDGGDNIRLASHRPRFSASPRAPARRRWQRGCKSPPDAKRSRARTHHITDDKMAKAILLLHLNQLARLEPLHKRTRDHKSSASFPPRHFSCDLLKPSHERVVRLDR
jgi:hypothetical protein